VQRCRRAVLWSAVIALGLPGWAAAAKAGPLAYSISLARDVDATSLHALEGAIDDARRQHAAVLILRLDTPGGEATSMREMVKAISAAPMPVIVYVHPPGARADSAGVPLALAADVAAMAPQTNIGSATPVWAGPPARTRSEDQTLRDLRRKAVNSGVAFVRTLAEDHGRNADLAERMVRDAANVTALQARKEGLIDIVAPNERALLRSLDGFHVKGAKAQRLETSGLQIKHVAAADVAPLDTGAGDPLDETSWWRSFALVFGVAGLVVLTLWGAGRGRSALRRRRRQRAKLRQR
jgi:membrane-bound serine protease (ClpP class)